jgi:hypothetical protein
MVQVFDHGNGRGVGELDIEVGWPAVWAAALEAPARCRQIHRPDHLARLSIEHIACRAAGPDGADPPSF